MLSRRLLPALIAAAFVATLTPAAASAAPRFASSQSSVNSGACDSVANACTLSYALTVSGAADALEVLSDGTYTLAAPIFGVAGQVFGESSALRWLEVARPP